MFIICYMINEQTENHVREASKIHIQAVELLHALFPNGNNDKAVIETLVIY